MTDTASAVLDGPMVGVRKRAGFMPADLLLITALGLLAVNFVYGLIAYFSGAETGETSTGLLWAGVVTNLVIFALLPLGWVASTVHGGWAGIRRYLGLTGGVGEAGIGVGVGVAMVVVLGGIAFLLDRFGLVPESAPITDLLKNITWPLAIAFSLVAGFGEEVLFRGILQRWLRWWGQGLLFGAMHIANAGLFAFTATAIIGVGFGYARHRGVSLWVLIVAHVTYDLILLSVAILFPDAAGTGGTAVLP